MSRGASAHSLARMCPNRNEMQPRVDLTELFALKNKYSNETYCDSLALCLYREHYGTAPSLDDERLLIEEYDDSSLGVSYGEYAALEISRQLELTGRCMVTVSNSSGEDKTMAHVFTLYLIGDSVFRLDSYGTDRYEQRTGKIVKVTNSLYGPRIVEWPTMEYDIARLLSLASGAVRHEPATVRSTENGLLERSVLIERDIRHRLRHGHHSVSLASEQQEGTALFPPEATIGSIEKGSESLLVANL